MTSTYVYDSDQPRRPIATELTNLWTYRGLLKLLVTRDLTVRYKRSTLGVWWTLLNPLLTMSVLWIIFSGFFRFAIPDVPYVAYLLSGILLITFFSQGVIATGSSIVNSASILSKVYVPPEVFAVSASVAALVNFGISLIPLIVIQLATGYRDSLGLGAETAFLVSDSGGVQEEISVYKRSVIVERRSTESPEVLGTFAVLVEAGPGIAGVARRWLDDLPALHDRLAELPYPYGDGTASVRSVAEIGALVGDA